MSEQNSTGCGGCGKSSLIPLKNEKWGVCPFCMGLASAGTIAGWSFTLSFWLLSFDRSIVVILAVLSVAFSLMLSLHLIAYRRGISRDGL